MPKTQPDPAFTAAVRRLVREKHEGKPSPAARELGVPRQHMAGFLRGAVPLDGRKQECLAALIKAGYYAVSMAPEVPVNVTLVTKNVTRRDDTAVLANMLKFLLDLVEKQQAAEHKPGVSSGSGE